MNPLVVISLDGIRAQDILDPTLRLPHIRRVMEEGASVTFLKTIFPSVTWAIHNSVVTGCLPARTGIFGNTVYDRGEGRRVSMFDPSGSQFDRDQRCPHLFGALAARGVDVAAVCWPLTQNSSAIRYNIPEFYHQAHFDQGATPGFWAELQAAGFPVDRYGAWSADHALNPLQDSLTAGIAAYLIEKKRPGALFLHFLLVDSYQHDFGVASPEARWALEFVDSLVGQIKTALEEHGEGRQTNLVLFSDHGHAATASAFYVDTWLEAQGFGGQPGQGPFVVASNGGVGYVYNLAASESEQVRLKAQLESLNWVQAVWTKEEFGGLGLPQSDPSGRLPDLVFELVLDHFVMTGEGPGIVVGPCAYRSMHGYRPEHPEMEGFLAASGPAFQPGAVVHRASVLDIAPLVNRVYELGLNGMDGTVPQLLRD